MDRSTIQTVNLIDPDYQEVLSKVRKVAFMFKRSPTKNDDVLQPYVKAKMGKELTLLTDCKTRYVNIKCQVLNNILYLFLSIRWSSLAIMVNRFLQLQTCVQKALIDLKSEILFTENDIVVLNDINDTLIPIKTAVEVLGSRNMNLISADVTVKFLIDKLKMLTSPLARKCADALSNRISCRRTELYEVLNFLHNPATAISSVRERDDIFTAANQSSVLKTVKGLVTRLMPEPNVDLSSEDEITFEAVVDSTMPISNSEIDLKDQLWKAIHSNLDNTQNLGQGSQSLHSTIKQEISLFVNGGTRGKYLEFAYQALLTVPPSSIESERSFSTSGNFCTKLRTRLSDNSLNALCFLRAHFLEDK